MAWLESDDPTLHLARLSTRPLTIGWTKRGDLVMSSTPETMLLTARLSGVAVHSIESLPEGTYLEVVDGEVVAETRFTVRTPARKVPDDRPGLVPAQRLSPTRERRLDDLGIDWDNLAGRRGWK